MEKKIKDLKIINILDFSTIIGTKDSSLQKNILKLHEIVGDRFIIKYESHLIIAVLFLNKTFTSNKEFFRLYYDGEIVNDKIIKYQNKIHYKWNLLPFTIDFIDPIISEINNNAYINTIHKTEYINGSTMIEFAKKICEQLGVKKVYLHDKASIIHNGKTLNLSLFKLIEKGRTFYSKFGFEYDINNINNYYTDKFDNIFQLKEKINSLIENIKKIKTNDLKKFITDILEIINKVMINNDYDNLLIKKTSSTIKDFLIDIYQITDTKSHIIPLYEKLNKILIMLSSIKNEYFYEYLIEIFNNPEECSKYNDILELLTLDGIYIIKYKEKELVNYFDYYFQNLNSIKNDHYYVFEYKN